MKLAVYSLGCRVNAFEAACIADRAREAGFEVVPWEGGADIGVVNSCALTSLAEAKTRQCVRMFARKNPSAKIAITGCYAQTNPEGARLENVEWVVGNDQKGSIIDIILDSLGGARALPERGAGAALLPSGDAPLSDRMNLKIQDGCDNFCAYCIIPRARGLPRSADFGAIVAAAENLVSRGVRELVITGINIAKFSTPSGGLVELLDRLSEIKSLLRLRLGSIEPPLACLGAVLERASDASHKLMPHLHISAQSLSDKVLAAMRRKYGFADFASMVEKCVSSRPDIAIGCDIICGHPEEGRAEFELTKKRLLGLPLAYAHVFTFSPRPQTLAWSMKNTPPAAERKARADELRAAAGEIRGRFVKSQAGREREVLLEHQIAAGVYFSHTDNYIPALIECPRDGMKNALVRARLEMGAKPGALAGRIAQ